MEKEGDNEILAGAGISDYRALCQANEKIGKIQHRHLKMEAEINDAKKIDAILDGAGISGKARAISQHENISKSASSVQALQRVNRP